MKRLLFFISTLAGGGAEKVVVDLLNSIDTTQYMVDLVTVSGGVHENRLSEEINHHTIVKNDGFVGRIARKIIYKLPSRLFNLLFLGKKYDLEIAYLEGFPTKIIAERKSKAKKLAFVHCDVSVKPILQKFYKSKAKCMSQYGLFDKVCFVSEVAKKGFEETYGTLERSMVIHNVIDTEQIFTKAKEETDFSFNTDGLKFISVGRLSAEKGFDRLIRLAAHLEKEYDFEICILGEGNQREDLQSLINELNVKSVRLLGYKENPYSYMKKADVFVCSSHFEGYSTVVTEAVVLGLPVITTDCAGMDEILENGRYGIITENSEEGLKEGLLSFLRDAEFFKNQKEAALLYSEKYSNEYAAEEYDQLFKEILS